LLSGYNFTTINVPGASQTSASGINDSGQFAGGYTDGSGVNHGFLEAGGGYTTIDFPGKSWGTASKINDSGQVVGSYWDYGTKSYHGFLEAGGTYTPINVPGTGWTQAFGINDSGQIVGSYLDTNKGYLGFLEAGGAYTPIDIPGSYTVAASGINDSGQVVGWYADKSTGGHGFLEAGGVYTTIDFPGASQTSAAGINDSGQIVGNYADNSSAHGFLEAGGVYTTIDAPGAKVTWPSAINDHGDIVGTYVDASGAYHSFLATTTKVVPRGVEADPKNPGDLLVSYEVLQPLSAGETVPIGVYWAAGSQASDALSADPPHGQARDQTDALGVYTVDPSDDVGMHSFDIGPPELLTAPALTDPTDLRLMVIADPDRVLGDPNDSGNSAATLAVSPHLGELGGFQLQELMPDLPADAAKKYAPLLVTMMAKYHISSLEQEAMFLGQLAVESDELRSWIEGAGDLSPSDFVTHYWVCPPDGTGDENGIYGTKWRGLGVNSYPTPTGLYLAVRATGKDKFKRLELKWAGTAKGFETVPFKRDGHLFVYRWGGSDQEPKGTTQLLVVNPRTGKPLLTISNTLGEFRSQDASDFCGRGPIQITGRLNYQQMANATGLSQIMTDPALVSDNVDHPEIGIQAAAWYFAAHDCNAASDNDQWDPSNSFNHDVTELINSKYIGENERLAQYVRIRALLLDPNF
jgi:predicted chitinase/uncharacterized membrane protein